LKKDTRFVNIGSAESTKINHERSVFVHAIRGRYLSGGEYIKDENAMQEPVFLEDRKKDKPYKLVNWRGHKLESYYLSESFKRLGEASKSARVLMCSNDLIFERLIDGTIKLVNAMFCKVRLCPMCSWRRSIKIFGQVSKVMDYITEHNDYRYLFITLTVKNVVGNELSKTIDILFASFKKLVERKEIRKIAMGWFRCLEVTHNWENGDDYHPHIHMIVAVKKSYFHSADYLSHEKLKTLWRDCVGLDYDPWVYIETVKPKKVDDEHSADYGKKVDYGKAVAEVAKYTVKSSDFIIKPDCGTHVSPENQKKIEKWANDETDKVVAVMDKALANRRLVAFGGSMRDAHKLLQLDSPEDGNLVNTDGEEPIRPDLQAVLEKYNWHPGWKNYVLEPISEQ
jgi:plasmid rolling circle replication initiator protein Rep